MTINSTASDYNVVNLKYSYESANLNDIHVDVSADRSASSAAHSGNGAVDIELILEDSSLRKKLAHGTTLGSLENS